MCVVNEEHMEEKGVDGFCMSLHYRCVMCVFITPVCVFMLSSVGFLDCRIADIR